MVAATCCLHASERQQDSATASLCLRHVDLATSSVYLDARDVRTKFSKSFTTFFYPVGDRTLPIVREWIEYLRETKQWGNETPLFPGTKMTLNAAHQCEAAGLSQEGWKSAGPIRRIFQEASRLPGSLLTALVREMQSMRV